MATHINVSGGKIVIGRFTVLPNEKMPAVPLTMEENLALKSFIEKGLFIGKEDKKAKADVKSEPATEPAPAVAMTMSLSDEPVAEAPVATSRKSARRKNETENTETVAE